MATMILMTPAHCSLAETKLKRAALRHLHATISSRDLGAKRMGSLRVILGVDIHLKGRLGHGTDRLAIEQENHLPNILLVANHRKAKAAADLAASAVAKGTAYTQGIFRGGRRGGFLRAHRLKLNLACQGGEEQDKNDRQN